MDPYGAGLAVGRPASIKSPLEATVCVVLDTVREKRGLQLIPPFTRCVRAGDVLELIGTDETDAAPRSTVDRVCGLAFAVASESGVIMVGDVVTSDDAMTLGVVVGFDVSHEPNHFNVVLRSPERLTGKSLDLRLGARLVFGGAPDWD